ncbi:hypothetical protein GCM10027569_58780 [Flindersiella endophytica]
MFRDVVSGTYRYLRLTINGPSARGHWPCSQELKVFGNGSPLENRRWIERSGPMRRYFPKHYGTKLTEITDQLDDLKEQGYHGTEISAPYKGSRTPWAGLGATDNYDIDRLHDPAPQTVAVELANIGIALDQVPIDVLDGRAGDPISGGTYRVTLPARGFAVLSERWRRRWLRSKERNAGDGLSAGARPVRAGWVRDLPQRDRPGAGRGGGRARFLVAGEASGAAAGGAGQPADAG